MNSFEQALQTKTEDEILKDFTNYVSQAREHIADAVRNELTYSTTGIDEKIQELDAKLLERTTLMQELDNRASYYHPGKWHRGTWTCCNETERTVFGCKEL